MKKIFLIATAAFLFTGATFAHEGGDGKKCAKGKDCCADCKKSNKKDEKKDAKTAKAAVKTATKSAAKA